MKGLPGLSLNILVKMFYLVEQILSVKECKRIFKKPKTWQLGWVQENNRVYRNDRIAWLPNDNQLWLSLRQHMTATRTAPMDFILPKFLISWYSVNSRYDWHSDRITNNEISVTARTCIIALSASVGTVIETQQGLFSLNNGQGIQIPSTDSYAIYGPPRTHNSYNNDQYFLFAWGAQRLSDKLFVKNF